LLGLV